MPAPVAMRRTSRPARQAEPWNRPGPARAEGSQRPAASPERKDRLEWRIPANPQPLLQALPAPMQPAAERGLAPAELAGRLLVGQLVQAAQDDRDREASREAGRSPRGGSRRARPIPSLVRVCPGEQVQVIGRLRARRTAGASLARARRATRMATPCSHGPIDPRRRIEPAFRTRTRNVAWKASSARFGSPTIPRQIRITIGPYRSTSTRKASDPRSSRRGTEPVQKLTVVHVAKPAQAEERLQRSSWLAGCRVDHDPDSRSREVSAVPSLLLLVPRAEAILTGFSGPAEESCGPDDPADTLRPRAM